MIQPLGLTMTPVIVTRRLFLLLIFCALLSACQQTVHKQPAPLPAAVMQTPEQLDYHFSVNDRLEVKFFYSPELNEGVTVRPDGRIALQLIGEVQVQGLTPLELERELHKKYQGILRSPEITVMVRQFTPARVYVGGQVNNPSEITLTGHLTALQAVLQAGGFRHGAKKNSVIVLRNNGRTHPEMIKIDLEKQVAWSEQTDEAGLGEVKPLNAFDIPLQDYDIVFIPQTDIARMAQFFEKYFNQILPIYRNLGFSINYEANSPSLTRP